MFKKVYYPILLLVACSAMAQGNDYLNAEYGQLLENRAGKAGLWWASSGWKISPDKPPPTRPTSEIRIRAARNEAEAAQLVVRPAAAMKGLTLRPTALRGPVGSVISAESVEILEVRYVNVTHPTDKS